MGGRAVRSYEDASKADVQAFFFKLLKKEAKSQPTFKPRVMVMLLQYLLRWLQSSDAAKSITKEGAFKAEVVTSLLDTLTGEMSRCIRWRPRWQLKATRALRKVLIAISEVALPWATAFLRKSEEPPALLVAAVTTTPGVDRAVMLELYTKHVLEAKKPLTDFALEAWKPVAKQSSSEELAATLLPTALRMMKRQPAASAVSFPSLVGSVQVDLSPHAKEILDLAPEKLKDKDKKLSGRGLVRDVVKASQLPALLAVAEAWAELAKKAAKADEKQATLQALAELAGNLQPVEDGSAFAKLIDPKGPLAKVAAEDANEETRFLAYRALGALALPLPMADQDQVCQELMKPLADKKAPDRARLAALTAMAQLARQRQGTPRSWTSSFVDKVLPWLTVAATKPVQRLQSLLGFAVCGSLAQESEVLGSKLKKDQLSLIKDGGSFLNAVPVILKAPHAELAAQAQFWGALLGNHVPGSPSMLEAAKAVQWLQLPPSPFVDCMPVARSAIVLLACLHASSPERAVKPEDQSPIKCLGLLEILREAKEEDADALLLLLAQALVAWMAEQASVPAKKRQVSSFALRKTLVDLCTAAAVKSVQPETLCLLSLAAHHPLLTSRRWPVLRHWRWLQRGPLGECFDKVGAGLWEPLRRLILAGRELPASDITGCRRAAVSVARALTETQEVTQLLRDCISALPSDQVAAEKQEDVKVFFAPEGLLWIEEGVYVAEERENKNISSKNKYLQGMDDDDVKETLPASRMKFAPLDRDKDKEKVKAKDPKAKAKAKAAAGEKGAMTQGQIEEAKIQEQSETRARIRCYVDQGSFVMDVMATLAQNKGHKEAFDEIMPQLVPVFLKLLQSPLSVLKARQCLRSLVLLVVPPTSISRQDLLADALTVVAKHWLSRSPAAAGTAGEERVCEVVLEGVDTHTALSGSTLALVLPIILRSLFDSSSQLQDLCTKALHLLERQLELGIKVSEETAMEVLDSLSVVLLALPGMATSSQATISAASKYMISSTEQLAKLAEMFFSDEDLMRSTVISALAALVENQYVQEETVDIDAARPVLRLGALDASADVAKQAIEDLELGVDEVLMMELIDFATNKGSVRAVQELIAKALAEVLTELDDPQHTQTALDLLTQQFREGPESRLTVARCLERIYATNLQGEEQVAQAFKFLLRQGLGLTNGATPEASELRDVLLAAGIALIEKHGEDFANDLFNIVEGFEDSAASSAAGESAHLGIAVYLGALSKHLGADHAKVPEILPRLLQRLQDKTSSTSVQNAIVKVMPPLMKQNKEQAAETLDQLLEVALAPKTDPTTRRGAAMGVGATVKGIGIQSISQHSILKRIEAAAEDKKSAAVREGALLCLEGLTLNLGRLFDPYVVQSLPLLLQAFSDSQRGVQKASQVAAGAMMSQLSGPGVKQVLKPLLAGIEDKQWRTKLGSIELLASMTSCLPKQLAACLPQVVPALCTVINDQHAKVKEAAREAINKVGSIISSPELRNIAPELISALTDGAQYEQITRDVLDKLLATSFVHHIDAASLSLVCPLIHRAMKERSADMKRKGAQMVGSMVLLIKDAKDIQPYLPLLIPQLKVTLVDPIPDVRATSAKAFGTLANALPEEMLGDVLPWLFESLRSCESAVERSGAAHGLSEVLMAKGADQIATLLPDILSNASNKEADPGSREGYLGLFVYLPVAMGNAFEPYIEEVMTMLLNGMSDDVTSVRDTAFKAAQTITKHFGSSHTALLLPPLEEGVFDVDWRIRHGAVQLMGQLIQQILRAHRIPTNSAELMQVEVLPKEWRCHMLASLYIVRSDENGVVKQACSQVWKAVVQNTPRTLRELLPTLMTRLIANLASTNREKQRVAARCVGDLVSKLGERVMPELMPIFMETLSEGDPHVREGVCIGLAELINATTKELLAEYLGQLIPAIQQAIIDDDESVRSQASTVVALLHTAVGPRATKDVVDWLLSKLAEEEEDDEDYSGDFYLHGLEQLMKKQPGAVLPIVLATLTSPSKKGWTVLQVQGLATLAVVPDKNAVHRHLSDVLPLIIQVASSADESEEMREIAEESAARLVDAVEQPGLIILLNELMGPMQDASNARRRVVAAHLLQHFFQTTGLDAIPALNQALPALLPSALADDHEEALSAAMAALNAVVKKCKKEELVPYLGEVRSAVLKVITDPVSKKVDPEIHLPGLCNHGGLEPLYPIYQHALVHGSPDARELAAKGLKELVDHTTEAALAPHAVKITGPLIRIVGDKFPGHVKKAIVEALQSLLSRAGATLKAFLPQLQTTYVKCLFDPLNTQEVREKAAQSLGLLARRAPRTEPLVNELSTGMANQADPAARVAMGYALGEVLLNLPAATTPAAQEKIQAAVSTRGSDDDATQKDRQVCGWALGVLMRRHLPTESAVDVLESQVKPALASASTRSLGAFALAGICWCQQPYMESPAEDELLQPAEEAAAGALPQLLKDSNDEAQCAGLALAASLAKLRARKPGSWEPLEQQADRLSALIQGDSGIEGRFPLLCARHLLGACAEAKPSLAAKVAAAAAHRGNRQEDPEDGERAVAAALPVKNRDEDGVKGSIEKLAASLDAKAAQNLKEFTQKRIRSLSFYTGTSDFAWEM
ncbi:unnamed protein product [Effrenium voratum]|uniref:TOG domain-containing protein n=1 Tax=Effrenium voratum TaxID=2562239 RepID=A0AA36JE46_9DINO|nr:unnamed protein product [Effrenium voratum]